MQIKIDWQAFKPEEEVAHLTHYIALNWDGFTSEQARQVANMGFMRGWESYGDHFDYFYHEGQQIIATQIALDRQEKLETLGYTPIQSWEDVVCKVLLSLDRLRFAQDPEAEFDTHFEPLLSETVAALGVVLTNARPRGWREDCTPKALEGASQEQRNAFGGCHTRNPCIPHFIDAIALDNVKDSDKHHDQPPHEVLLGALYAHGVLVRKAYNQERFGAAIAGIDANQPYVAPGAKVDVPAFAPLERLLQKSASKERRSQEVLSLINWVPTPAFLQDAPSL